jgi:hypothetical protein
MKIREQLPHWGNFTIPELKEILEHCVALERLGITEDKEMMRDIERDITLREERSKGYVHRTKIIRNQQKIPKKINCTY